MIVFYLKNVFQSLEGKVKVERKETSEGDVDQHHPTLRTSLGRRNGILEWDGAENWNG